jgi:hypothetical protein
MTKNKTKNKQINSTYFKTTIILFVYLVISYLLLIVSLANPNVFISFLVPLIFGVISSVIFLYLFSHKNFIPFIKKIEDRQRKSEEKYLKKFIRFGNFFACILVSLIGGPIFLALTVHLLFPKSHNKYQITIISSTITSILFVTLVKSFLKMIL